MALKMGCKFIGTFPGIPHEKKMHISDLKWKQKINDLKHSYTPPSYASGLTLLRGADVARARERTHR